jgi:pilus assembly protein Flp/PilA
VSHLPNHLSRPTLTATRTEKEFIMLKSILAVFADEEGASLVEYALIVALVSVVAIAALKTLGSNASNTLSSAAASMSS